MSETQVSATTPQALAVSAPQQSASKADRADIRSWIEGIQPAAGSK